MKRDDPALQAMAMMHTTTRPEKASPICIELPALMSK